MISPGYVELHCHSCFSFREGAATPLELILTARELGYDTLALTDHDSLAGAMEFTNDARDWDVTPIIGAEITLHAKDTSNIQHPTSNIAPSTSLRPPTTSPSSPKPPAATPTSAASSPPPTSTVQETTSLSIRTSYRHAPKASSRCQDVRTVRWRASLRPKTSRERHAPRRAYADLFGRDNFFIELQDTSSAATARRNRALVEIARRLGLGVVATNNVHYHVRERHRLHDVLVAVRHRTNLEDAPSASAAPTPSST